ncbi:MAG: sugar transferase [Candidatus Nanopelagicales bacterium]
MDSSTDPLRSLTYVALAIDVTLMAAATLVGLVLRGTGQYDPLAAGLILVAWVTALSLRGAYVSGRIGIGSEEFKNVISATVGTFALFASVGFILEITDGRKFLIGTFAAGLILLPLGRRLMRVWVFQRRRAGHLMQRTLVIGAGPVVPELERRLMRDPRAGFEVVLSLNGPRDDGSDIDFWLDRVERAIRDHQVDAVAITHTPTVTSEVIRRLSWRLEGPSVDLLVAPTLGDVTGPRLNVRPAAGLPLLHLEEPRLTGPQALLKRGTDIFVASVGLLLISPLLVLIAIAVRLTSHGPALFVQKRVGKAGATYRLVKFRTMYEGSEHIREEALGSLEADPQAYRNDPRITPLGKFLRRWSLDELPQLWNVLTGSMSLVGPRPMLIDELALLGTADHRRHLTKPGMTGLWQVAGRKEVAWNERMQMDLRYVENWSPALDAVILVKTVKAVATGRGAH